MFWGFTPLKIGENWRSFGHVLLTWNEISLHGWLWRLTVCVPWRKKQSTRVPWKPTVKRQKRRHSIVKVIIRVKGRVFRKENIARTTTIIETNDDTTMTALASQAKLRRQFYFEHFHKIATRQLYYSKKFLWKCLLALIIFEETLFGSVW